MHPYFLVFVNVKQGQLIMYRTLNARDWYGLAFNEVASEVMGRPSTGGGSARDLSGIWSLEAVIVYGFVVQSQIHDTARC